VKYRYLLLRHQPILGVQARETFAVLVKGQFSPHQPFIFVVGRSPEPPLISPVGKAIIEKFPEILIRLIEETISSKDPSEDVLDCIHKAMSWNFYATSPESLEDSGPIHEVAFKLFSTKVAGADQFLKSIQEAFEEMLRPHISRQLGDMFQTVIPIPEFKPAISLSC